MIYKITDGLGQQLTGTGQSNSPRYTMRPRLVGYQPSGTSAAGSAVDQPGPGTYAASAAFGQQVHSARNSAASFSFGSSVRTRPELHPKKTQYIGKDYERQNWGINSPGPMQYSQGVIGANADPRKKQSASFSFGSESRFMPIMHRCTLVKRGPSAWRGSGPSVRAVPGGCGKDYSSSSNKGGKACERGGTYPREAARLIVIDCARAWTLVNARPSGAEDVPQTEGNYVIHQQCSSRGIAFEQ